METAMRTVKEEKWKSSQAAVHPIASYQGDYAVATFCGLLNTQYFTWRIQGTIHDTLLVILFPTTNLER